VFPADSRILIIDDLATMRHLIKKTLSDLGYKNLLDAENGERAWKVLEDSHSSGSSIQLIIADWNMPELTGIDLLRRVRGHQGMHTTPFIMVTCEGEQENIMKAVDAGVSNYIIKPFAPKLLKDKLTQVWDKLHR